MASHFIAFFGPDGSGKSTHASLLIYHLRSHKVQTRKVWIRSPHTFAYLLSCLLVKVGFYRVVLNSFGYDKKIPAVHINRGLKIFWSLAELISIMPVVMLRVYLPLLLGYTVVAERCIVDTIVNIAYYTKNLEFLQSRTAKILLRFIPKNAILIHLDVDYPTLVNRRGRIVEAYELIKFQKECYKKMENLLNAAYINTSCSDIKYVNNLIINLVENRIKMMRI